MKKAKFKAAESYKLDPSYQRGNSAGKAVRSTTVKALTHAGNAVDAGVTAIVGFFSGVVTGK